MSDTIVITEPEPVAAEPEPVTVVEPEPEPAADVASAVGDAVAETVDTIVTANTIRDTTVDGRYDAICARLDSLAATVESLAAQPKPEPEPEPETVVVDEIQPDRRHSWFRPLSEWRER